MTSPCLTTRRLCYRYDEDNPALDGVDLAIPDNSFLAIMGQNGSGKTTLVKHFNGLLTPTSGNVQVYGTDTRSASLSTLARTVGLVFQNPDHQIFGPTTRAEIAFGPSNLGMDSADVRTRVEEALAQFDLLPYADMPPATLGYGLRRKVSVAAVFAMRPRILILDEPTAGLDWCSIRQLMEQLVAFHASGHTVLLVTHDMRVAIEYSHQGLVMHAGRVVAYGRISEVFRDLGALRDIGLIPPPVVLLRQRLAPLGLPDDCLTVRAFCEAYAQLRGGPG